MPYATHENDVQYLADDGTVLGEVTFPSCGDGIVDINHICRRIAARTGHRGRAALPCSSRAEKKASGAPTPHARTPFGGSRSTRSTRICLRSEKKPPHIRNQRAACALRPASRLRPRRGAGFCNFWALDSRAPRRKANPRYRLCSFWAFDSRMSKYKAIPRYHNRRSEAWPICRY